MTTTYRALTTPWHELEPVDRLRAIDAARMTGEQEARKAVAGGYRSTFADMREFYLIVAVESLTVRESWSETAGEDLPADDPRLVVFTIAFTATIARRAQPVLC